MDKQKRRHACIAVLWRILGRAISQLIGIIWFRHRASDNKQYAEVNLWSYWTTNCSRFIWCQLLLPVERWVPVNTSHDGDLSKPLWCFRAIFSAFIYEVWAQNFENSDEKLQSQLLVPLNPDAFILRWLFSYWHDDTSGTVGDFILVNNIKLHPILALILSIAQRFPPQLSRSSY